MAASRSDPKAHRVPILLVDDREANLVALQAVLKSPSYELVTAHSGEEALVHVRKTDFAVALVDVMMPSMDGFETSMRMRQDLADQGRRIPIIFVTAIDTPPSRVLQAYADGGVDLIQKPFEPVVLRAKVSVFADLYLARRRVADEQSEAKRRLETLTDLALALSHTRTRDEVASVISAHGARAAQADACTVHILDEGETPVDMVADHGSSRDWRIPLVVEGRTLGLIHMRFRDPRPFSPLERSFVEAFAQQCGQAMLRAMRLEREDEVRRRMASDRARNAFLATAGEALVSSLDYQATLTAVARLAVPELADWCSIDLCEPGSPGLRQVAVAERGPDTERLAREILTRDAHERPAQDAPRDLRLDSAIVVPLRAHGHTLGVMTFVYTESGRLYTADDFAFAKDFARRAALAIESAAALKETEAARAREHALRDEAEGSARMFGELVENLPELAWTARPDGHVDFYNRRWYEFTGTTPDQVEGWGWKSAHDPAMLDRVVERWTECLRTGEPFEMEFPLRGADGAMRWFLTRVRPLRDAAGRIVRWIGISTDIDERRRNEDFREIFLGILGHELRNPLNTILLTARLMVDSTELSAASAKSVQRQIASGVRMQRMIDQLLDLTRARLAGGIPIDRSASEKDLVSLVTKIVDEQRGAHPGRAIKLHVEGPCAARVDADRIEQVVSNLLGNALAHGDPDQPVTVVVKSSDHAVKIAVHNMGQPIDPEFLPLLFNPFARGEKSAKRSDGLGLGLYISERIVSAHGGTLEVESSAEKGTRFEVTIPRADPRHGLGPRTLPVATTP
jgi:PAS domain S-box-containing protein